MKEMKNVDMKYNTCNNWMLMLRKSQQYNYYKLQIIVTNISLIKRHRTKKFI